MNNIMKRVLILTVPFLIISCKATDLNLTDLKDVNFTSIVEQGEKLWNANNVTEEQEIQLGENMAAVLLGTRPLVKNDKLNRYVNDVGLWLATNSERPDLPWKFGVIDSEAVNAFAAPGGYIFITQGMLSRLSSEAELAAVLAHEIIHVVEQHHLEAVQTGTTRNVLTQAFFDSAEFYQQKTGSSSQNKAYREWAQKITSAAQDLYSKGLDRGDEFEADQQGIRLLARSGYDPYAFIGNLQILESIDPKDSALALMYKTHPTPTERLEAIGEQLEKLDDFSDGQVLAPRFRRNIK